MDLLTSAQAINVNTSGHSYSSVVAPVPQRIGLRVEVHADDVADARGKDAAVTAVEMPIGMGIFRGGIGT